MLLIATDKPTALWDSVFASRLMSTVRRNTGPLHRGMAYRNLPPKSVGAMNSDNLVSMKATRKSLSFLPFSDFSVLSNRKASKTKWLATSKG